MEDTSPAGKCFNEEDKCDEWRKTIVRHLQEWKTLNTAGDLFLYIGGKIAILITENV